ncbi:MAG: hypothetical protein WC802_05450 [Patescibacteria group bacterium]|jgi:hypothetical protein
MTLPFGLLYVVGSAFAQDPAKLLIDSKHAGYADRAGLSTTATHMMCDGVVVDGCTITQLQEKLKELQKQVDGLPTGTTSGTGGSNAPSANTVRYRLLVDQLLIDMRLVQQRLDTIAGRPFVVVPDAKLDATKPAVPGETPAPAGDDAGLIGAMQAQITAMQVTITALQAQMAAIPAPIEQAPVAPAVTNNITNTLDGVHIVLGLALGPTFQATVGGRAAPVSTSLSASFGVKYAKDGKFVQGEVAPQIGYWDIYGLSAKLVIGGELGDDSGLELGAVLGGTTSGIQADLSQQGSDVAFNGMDVGGRIGVDLGKVSLTGTFTFQPFYSVVGFAGSDHLYGTGFMQPTATIGLSYMFGSHEAEGDDKPTAEEPEQAERTAEPAPQPAPEAVPAKTEAPPQATTTVVTTETTTATVTTPVVPATPAPVAPVTPPASPWMGDPDAKPMEPDPVPPEVKLP